MSIRIGSTLRMNIRCTINRLPCPQTIGALLLTSVTALSAQTTPSVPNFPTEFPVDALALTPQELQQRLDGKVYTAKLADGIGWRVEYRGEYVFVNVSTGPSDKGRWRVDGTRVCATYDRFPSSCSEIRASATRLYLKRSTTGEVVGMDVLR